MKIKALSELGVFFLWAILVLVPSSAQAGGAAPARLQESTPTKVTPDIFDSASLAPHSYFDPRQGYTVRDILNLQREYISDWILAQKVEKILNKFGPYIPLNQNPEWATSEDLISPVGITQELWATVMKNNPSFFQLEEHCPQRGAHRVEWIGEAQIQMCVDFPVETVSFQNQDLKDSDEELISKMNEIYKNAGFTDTFRRQFTDEFNWADTEGGLTVRGLASDQWRFYALASYSMGIQPPNRLGFRRSGVWEGTGNQHFSDRYLVGGAWKEEPYLNQSGRTYLVSSKSKFSHIGPSRLVRNPGPLSMAAHQKRLR